MKLIKIVIIFTVYSGEFLLRKGIKDKAVIRNRRTKVNMYFSRAFPVFTISF